MLRLGFYKYNNVESAVPIALDATNVSYVSFDLNLTEVGSADAFFIDVATDSNFTNFVTGYENKFIGKYLTYHISGLNYNSNYYYRVRSINGNGISRNSNTIGLLTLNTSIDALIIAGGGGGGITTSNDQPAGGGGAGGYMYLTGLDFSFSPYFVLIGGGGRAGNTNHIGYNGSDSSFHSLTAIGGGGGGNSDFKNNGGNGGSGGGGGYYSLGNGNGGIGISNQGYKGGNCTGNYNGGGGGGASQSGYGTVDSGYGGDGLSNSINGTATYRAGGGSAGASFRSMAVNGGRGGGGKGGMIYSPGSNGAVNTGGGGGGAGEAGQGYSGGSGIVIISYPTEAFGNCTGGVKTTNGNKTVHTFTSSGTMTFVSL